MNNDSLPANVGSNDGLGVASERGVIAQLRLRILREHGGVGDGWRHHGNLTHGDSLMHREAVAEIERLQGVADEYNLWIRFHSAADGDFDDFLTLRLGL